jgi:hypothetical protein
MKLFEAFFLLAAGVVFVWWQLRDVRIAQENTKRQRERERAQALEGKVADDATGKTGDAP